MGWGSRSRQARDGLPVGSSLQDALVRLPNEANPHPGSPNRRPDNYNRYAIAFMTDDVNDISPGIGNGNLRAPAACA